MRELERVRQPDGQFRPSKHTLTEKPSRRRSMHHVIATVIVARSVIVQPSLATAGHRVNNSHRSGNRRPWWVVSRAGAKENMFMSKRPGKNVRPGNGPKPGRSRWLLVVGLTAVVLAAIVAAGVTLIDSEPIDYHAEAKAHLEKGDYVSAIIQFKNEVRTRPENAQARLDLAVIYLLLGDGASFCFRDGDFVEAVFFFFSSRGGEGLVVRDRELEWFVLTGGCRTSEEPSSLTGASSNEFRFPHCRCAASPSVAPTCPCARSASCAPGEGASRSTTSS